MSFCFWCKRIEKRRFEYVTNSYHDEFVDLSPRTLVLCHTLLHTFFLSFLMDLTIAHMILVHERTALSLDALVTTHTLIVVIVSRVYLVFLLEGSTPTLSRDTWMVHIFFVVVHVPLNQVVRCKGL
jgi:hypothetical protein